MSTVLALKCACGKIQGIATDGPRSLAERSVCFCDDCQAFAAFLGREDTLDQWGGTDVYPMAPARVELTAGQEHLGCVRLTADGLYRWYCRECKTPIANTVGGFIPFIGLIHSFLADSRFRRAKDELGVKPKAYVMTPFALGTLPPEVRPTAKLRLIGRTLLMLLKWIVTGVGSPSPFFDKKTRVPCVEAQVLSAEERQAL